MELSLRVITTVSQAEDEPFNFPLANNKKQNLQYE